MTAGGVPLRLRQGAELSDAELGALGRVWHGLPHSAGAAAALAAIGRVRTVVGAGGVGQLSLLASWAKVQTEHGCRFTAVQCCAAVLNRDAFPSPRVGCSGTWLRRCRSDRMPCSRRPPIQAFPSRNPPGRTVLSPSFMLASPPPSWSDLPVRTSLPSSVFDSLPSSGWREPGGRGGWTGGRAWLPSGRGVAGDVTTVLSQLKRGMNGIDLCNADVSDQQWPY